MLLHDITSCGHWREELLNGHSVKERPTCWVLLDPNVVEDHLHHGIGRPESPSIGIATGGAV